MRQSELKEMFHYSPDTGVFTRLVTISNQVAGKVAGCVDKRYTRIRINDRLYLAHRLAYLYMKGYMPKEIDHIDRNTNNNKWNNLRATNRRNNLHNTKARNKLGVKGCEKCGNQYRAKATYKKKFYHLGLYPTLEEASRAYQTFVEDRYDTA
jgi:hypothetical protein